MTFSCSKAAAVSLVLIAALAATTIAQADPLEFSKIKPEDLKTLPKTTQVSVHGQIATIADLEARHQARLQRFSVAASAGAQIKGSMNAPFAPIGPTYGLVTNAPSKDTYPKDYVDFCTAAAASVCVYVPPQTVFSVSKTGTFMIDFDPYMTASQCTQEGGISNSSECLFYYPVNSGVHYNEGPPAPSIQSTCFKNGVFNGIFKGVNDVHGYFDIQLLDVPGANLTNTGMNPITCVGYVYAMR